MLFLVRHSKVVLLRSLLLCCCLMGAFSLLIMRRHTCGVDERYALCITAAFTYDKVLSANKAETGIIIMSWLFFSKAITSVNLHGLWHIIAKASLGPFQPKCWKWEVTPQFTSKEGEKLHKRSFLNTTFVTPKARRFLSCFFLGVLAGNSPTNAPFTSKFLNIAPHHLPFQISF